MVSKPGVYEVIVKATDKDGASSTKTFKVTVKAVESNVTMKPDSAEFYKVVNDEMFRLVNELRQSVGVKELKISSIANECAMDKVNHMAEYKYFDHIYQGKLIWQIYEDKYKGSGITGENILWRTESNKDYTVKEAKDLALRIFKQWENSPSHRTNMISRRNLEIGFAFKIFTNGKVLAAQEFVTKK